MPFEICLIHLVQIWPSLDLRMLCNKLSTDLEHGCEKVRPGEVKAGPCYERLVNLARYNHHETVEKTMTSRTMSGKGWIT